MEADTVADTVADMAATMVTSVVVVAEAIRRRTLTSTQIAVIK